ncbi:MAG TPA: sigma-70 family RNA polymerase sigma factor [Bacteroidota bacterium]|nr:sigma-70 family RNA polymerase sigma factor [Bacteroidota bacterium]
MWLVPLSVLALWLEQAERNTEDLALIERVKRRDEQALAKLYDRYAQLLYTLALRIVSTSEEAEDVLQEVFLQIWNRSNTYMKERGTVYSWVVTLTRNKAIDRVRSKRYKQQAKEVKLDDAAHLAESHTTNPQHAVVLKEYQEIVAAAQKKLSSVEAQILDLSYYGGYSQTEIAKMLKMPLGTVKTKMRQGIIKLRQALRQGRSER